MAEILGANIPTPSWEFFGSSLGWTITFTMIIILILALGGVFVYMIFQARMWNRNIEYYENISGIGYQRTFKDKARVIKVGDGGEEVLFWKKKKVYRTAYGKKMGKNLYWFAKGQDGYDYNIVLGDLDAKMGMLDIEPIDRDMRYMHVAIRKNIQDRYRKHSALEQYIPYIMSGIMMVIMIVGMWFIMDKISDIATNIAPTVESAQKVNEASAKILSSLENLCSSSGIKPI